MAEAKKTNGKKVDGGQAESKLELKGKEYIVDLSMSEENIRDLNTKGATLLFDDESFPQLSDEVVRDFSYENKQNFFVTRATVLQREKFLKSGGERGQPKLEILSPLDGKAKYRLMIKDQDKDGVHVAFKRPDEISGAEDLGYKRVKADDEVAKRIPGTRQDANGNLQVLRRSGEVDLVPMTIPAEVHKKHLHAVAAKSRSRVRGAKDDFKDLVKDKGRRNKGLSVIDESE